MIDFKLNIYICISLVCVPWAILNINTCISLVCPWVILDNNTCVAEVPHITDITHSNEH